MKTREEDYHNTPAQIAEYVHDALTIVAAVEVEEGELEPRLRAAIFNAAVSLRAAKQVTFVEAPLGFDLNQLPGRRPL